MTGDFDYSIIDSGVRELVKWLHGQGFETTDSHDGGEPEFECAPDHPQIIIRTAPAIMVRECDRLFIALVAEHGIACTPPGPGDEETAAMVVGGTVQDWPSIQASYDPSMNSAVLILEFVTDEDLSDEEDRPEPGLVN